MQRRRKPKSEPRNIFDKGSSPRPSKPSPSQRRTPPQVSPPKPASKPAPPTPKPQPVAPKPVQTPPKSQPTASPAPEAPVTAEAEAVDVQEEESQAIVEEQLLGTPRRKSRGLQPVEEVAEESATELNNRTSSKAMEIIEASKARATANFNEQQSAAAPKAAAPAAPAKPRPNRRRTNTSFQPAAREKRLDRSRHMEYKYEVRGLLKEMNVADEHRSALLGTIWAKGERQTSAEAVQFIVEKQSEGIIDQEQAERLMAVVDDYTIRR